MYVLTKNVVPLVFRGLGNKTGEQLDVRMVRTSFFSSDREDTEMIKFNKTVLAAMLAGATALSMSSAQAWWGPWNNNGYGDRGWGNNGWGDGMGDMFGDGDFDMSFSGRGSGRGTGRGYGRGYNDYYNRGGYGGYGYPYGGYGPGYGGPGYGYGGPGYGAPYGGAPYGAPYGAPGAPAAPAAPAK